MNNVKSFPPKWDEFDSNNFGGGGVDAVIDLGTYSDAAALSDLTGGYVPSGTAEMIRAKLAAGEMPKIMGKIRYSYYDNYHYGSFYFTAFGDYGPDDVKCYCDIQTYSGHYSLIVHLFEGSSTPYIVLI